MMFPIRPVLFALVVMLFASPLSVFGGTANASETPTPWIHPPTRTLTSIPGFTASATPTPMLPTIPSGRNLTTVPGTATPKATPTPLTLPDGCKFHRLVVEADKDYSELTFRCPNATPTATVGSND